MGVLILGLESDNQTCDIFRSLFVSKNVSFNYGGTGYLIFGDLIGTTEHLLRSHYLAFLILRFFDKESEKLVEPNFEKSYENSLEENNYN